MNASRASNDLAFSLRFYDQTQDVIDSVVGVAVKAHPRISRWTQNKDQCRGGWCEVVTLWFNDRTSLEAFRKDEQFVDEYLSSAWGKQVLGRDSLRVKPSIADERGTIPGDMFVYVGI